MPIDSSPQPPLPPDPDRVIAALRDMTGLFAAFVQDVHKAMRLLLQSEQAGPRRPWRFVPETMTLEPEDGRPVGHLTAEEVERQQMPPCPSCGATIELDWIDVHTTDDPEPMYVPGAWCCPADPRHPRTGERADG